MLPRQLTFPLIFLLTACYSSVPYLGDQKSVMEESLLSACENFNAYESRFNGIDSAASLLIHRDTITYSVMVDDMKYTYIFSNNECTGLNLKLSYLRCVHRNRKWLFRGKWRVDENGYLYRRRVPTIASIKRAEDCPYLYEVNLTRLDTAFQKKEYKKLEKVDKKLIGTRKYLMRER